MGSEDPTYFIGLPTECIEIITRLHVLKVAIAPDDVRTDSTTKSENYYHGLPLLLSSKSPFRTVASSIFTKLRFDSTHSRQEN